MQFDRVYLNLLSELIDAPEVDVGEWHAMDVKGNPQLVTQEIRHLTFELHVPETTEELREQYEPNLPWADIHFGERVSGVPLNPPPSHELWPFAMKGNETHMKDQKFSHTYPERYWPKEAGHWNYKPSWNHYGISFQYGDLNDLIKLLATRPMTRQAYLPVWFPEDLTAANMGERCPCSIGYHFLIREDLLHCEYQLRSCDFIRHFRDDMYLTARLMQCVRDSLQKYAPDTINVPDMGDLVVHIGSLHCMKGDVKKMKEEYETLTR